MSDAIPSDLEDPAARSEHGGEHAGDARADVKRMRDAFLRQSGGSDRVSASSVATVLHELGVHCSPEDLAAVLHKLGLHEDGLTLEDTIVLARMLNASDAAAGAPAAHRRHHQQPQQHPGALGLLAPLDLDVAEGHHAAGLGSLGYQLGSPASSTQRSPCWSPSSSQQPGSPKLLPQWYQQQHLVLSRPASQQPGPQRHSQVLLLPQLAGSSVSTARLSMGSNPFRAFLDQRRSLMAMGRLPYDPSVSAYLEQLKAHRKKCEQQGRYMEADAATRRVQELHSMQAARLRQELLGTQQHELQQVLGMHQREEQRLAQAWEDKVRQFEETFGRQVEALRQQQAAQQEQLLAEMARRRPQRPKPSCEFLHQRRLEERALKLGDYGLAHQAKRAADAMYGAEFEQTLAMWEAGVRLRQAKMVSKHQLEGEGLLQRGARARDELELRRGEDVARQANRYRAVVSELRGLQKVEVAQLENLVDGQVLAGKFEPLKSAGFRRARDTLLDNPILRAHSAGQPAGQALSQQLCNTRLRS